ncbi:PTS transporter subunit EIIC [Streptomyces antibioticus]|uniref:PTS transporter subunit EIIC n=1 Tax=Streptomyces antibioticus TaxID=1890 RepID=UPI00224F8AB6|nr:PTS transporter subunit EIIC [Streptomyces antibioticus]MCX5169315.1 PTS transporter subunit EIIC [Streptomyces antibioticus]
MSTATAPPAAPAKKWGSGLFQGLQKVGRSLQLPIAVLPAAGLLLRLGQADVKEKLHLPTDVAKVFAGAGGALLDSSFGLPLLFCIGVAIGFAKKADGSTALAAVVSFLTYYAVIHQFPIEEGHEGATYTSTGLFGGFWQKGTEAATSASFQNPGVLGGIILGLLTAVLWQRYHRKKLVDWLGFFNGRRLVPIIMAVVGTALGVLVALGWQPIGDVITDFGEWMTGLGSFGAAVFGLINRALIPIGMHQFVNSVAWFQIGDYTDAAGTVFHGDLPRFFAGDPDAGMFMTGFFPIMMFGLPAAALAIAHSARPERRKVVLGMMTSLALTSFITGVTEPIEFSFMFIAPALYAIHAVLTAVSMAVTWALGIHMGFGFSAGLTDVLINWGISTKPWLMIPVGLAFGAIYYVVFRFAITKFNLPTPGREPEEEVEDLTKA